MDIKKLDKDSPFIKKLHEDWYLDVELFNEYIQDCKKLTYDMGDDREKMKQVIAEIIDIFEYTLLTLFFHFDPNDASYIKNYNQITDEEIQAISDDIRETSKLLIQKL